jgi:MFS family permease
MLCGVNPFAPLLTAFARVFANRSVRKVQLAGMGSILGTYAYAVALPVYAYHSGGTRAVGLLFFARLGLAALAAPWLGVIADRGSRRRLMLAADIARTGIFAAMTAVAATGGSAYLVYVLAVSSTIIGGCYPPAQAALLPSLVESPEELTSANLVGNTLMSVGMFVGPALGGILLALSGTSAVFALTGASFLWSALFVFQVRPDAPPEQAARSPFLPAVSAGFAAVLRRPALRVLVGLSAAHAMVEGGLQVLLVVLAIRLLDSGNAGVGWLNTAMGVGSIAGAAVVAVLAARRRLAGGFGLGILLWGFPIAAAAAATTLAPALVLLALVGIGAILVQVNGMTLMQRSAENDVLGRVFAVLESLILASMALGALIAPGLVSWLGPRGALIAAGAFLPTLLLPLWPSLRRIDAEAAIAAEPLDLLRRIEIFAQLPEPVLEQLASGAGVVSAAPFQAVVSQGEPGHTFYVIAEGRVAVDVDGAEARELGPGEFFGEIALLRDVPRTATVRALEALRLYAVERDEFLAAVTGHAPTLAAAENIVTSRLPAGALLG